MPETVREGTCEIKWCRRDGELISVSENIGDGSWLIGICTDCAAAIGVDEGDDLPDSTVVYARLKKAGRVGHAH